MTNLTDTSAEKLARLYAHPSGSNENPWWVRLNFVTTVDGSVTGTDGTSGNLGGAPDHAAFAAMRQACDVVLVGAGTVRAEGYGPITPDSVDAERRVAAGRSAVPRLAIVTRSGDLPDQLRGTDSIVITPSEDSGEIDWPARLAELAAAGMPRILCEGGPHLAGTLLAGDLVDDICLTVAPQIAGGDGPRLTAGTPDLDRSLHLAHAVTVDDVLLTRWLRHPA